jgi:hypothetical protein
MKRRKPSPQPAAKPPVDSWTIRAALQSYAALERHLSEMDLQDCELALEFEHSTRRRKVVLRRLLQRATRLNEREYVSRWEAKLWRKGNKAKS